jgi:hypothetical protein
MTSSFPLRPFSPLGSGAERAVGTVGDASLRHLPGRHNGVSPNLVTLLLWGGLAAALLVALWPQIPKSLVSQDDAMRLVEVRGFLHGRSWFDMIEPRLGFAPGYASHWSRLIDAPLAGLILAFSAIGGPAFGEAAARATWPLLLLLPLLLSITALAEDVGGRIAALRAPFFAFMCLGGLVLFRPGVIHHHNAQMTLSAVFLALSLRAPRSRAAAISAGAVGALALAVGLEALAILGVAALGYALRFVIDPEEGRHFGAFAVSVAVSSLVLFVATVPPSLWSTTQCDAYAANLFVGVAISGLGAGLTTWLCAKRGTAARLLGLIAAGALALVSYGLSDPSCLKGPFGHIDPQIWPLWLSHVAEMRSVPRLIADDPSGALLYLGAPLIGVAALPLLWRRNRTPQALILGTVLIIASIIGALHIRGLLYASWFAVPVVAAISCRVELAPTRPAPDRKGGPRPLTLVLVGLLIATSIIASSGLWRTDPQTQAGRDKRDDGVCAEIRDYADLAALPAGLVLAHVDLGPYVLATTHHRVLVAPYHRLQKELIFARRLGAGEPAAAEDELRRAGVDYVVECRGETDPVEDDPASLRSALMSGHPPTFLEPIASGPSPLLIFRLRK